jgi:hypothetical protein
MSDPQCAALLIDDLHDIASRRVPSLDDVRREDPGMSGRNAVRALTGNPNRGQRIACSRAIRSAVDGCVENSFMKMSPPLNGFTMNRWAVAGEASIGIRLDQVSSFCKPEISSPG